MLSEIYYIENIETTFKNLHKDLAIFSHVIDKPNDASSQEWRIKLKRISQLNDEEKSYSFILYASKDTKNIIVDLTLRRLYYEKVNGRYYYSILDTKTNQKSNSHGIEKVDSNKPFYIVEDFFDQLALDNSISCGGFFNITDLLSDLILQNVKRKDITIVIDHKIESDIQQLKLKWLNSQGYSVKKYS